MRHAVYLPPFENFGDVHVLVDLAVSAEDAGWDGFFLWDHVLYEKNVPFVDAWVTLAAIATRTSTIRVGPLVTPLPRRRPWKVARESVTLDHLSGGRLVLGVGLGIDFWREFSAFGEPATTDKHRAELLDEGLDILTGLWSGDPVTYEGGRFRVDGARFRPTPVQQPRIPLWCAVMWPPSREGPVARAARCDGVMPFSGRAFEPGEVAEVIARVGRTDPGYDVVVWGDGTRARDYEAAGVTWLIESFGPDTPADTVRRVVSEGPPRA